LKVKLDAHQGTKQEIINAAMDLIFTGSGVVDTAIVIEEAQKR
jgi:hypothetical protein